MLSLSIKKPEKDKRNFSTTEIEASLIIYRLGLKPFICLTVRCIDSNKVNKKKYQLLLINILN
jgi:hypothetical protein